MLRRCVTLLTIMLVAFAGTACREARMAAPLELVAGIPAWNVEQTMAVGWDAPFTFGPYTVKQIRRGWTKSNAWGFMGYESYQAGQSYEYLLDTGVAGKSWHCNCAVNVSQKVLEGMVGDGKLTWEVGAGQRLACSLRPPRDKPWRLALAASGASNAPMQGVLEGPGLTVRVRGTDKLEGTTIPLSEPVGYVFAVIGAMDGTVGAVQVINNGVLWLPDSPQQPALAAAAAALLLHQDISRKP